MKNLQITFNSFLFLLLIGLAFTSCSSDDDNAAVNQAPNSFNLLEVADGLDVQPQLTWESATDPDGDSVTYQVYLDTQNPPQTSIANNLGVNTLSVQDELQPETNFYWMVTAKDSHGNTTQSNIDSFMSRDMTTAETLVGKWMLYSKEGEPPFSDCYKTGFFRFTDDLSIEIKEYDINPNGDCIVLDQAAASYKVIENNQIEITVANSENIIWEIQSLTKTELVLNMQNNNILTFKKE
ncbi:hypothetical protein KCTC52924_01095 [Arenibacter antarcticus]|uniref:Lipocalin family protein n=1 Tax=Arenibacter antarcticus TaxID=2040469 RepID=A0ABW5VEW6_9FLAO|nr:lipocalin family protein [Arenibacter sp. H213]MCM4167409.1 hypothetical protein [Arenibacter sp. H213]